MRGLIAALGPLAVSIVLAACGSSGGAGDAATTVDSAATPPAAADPPVIDGRLDCGPGEGWSETRTFAEDATGPPTAELALNDGLSPWLDGDTELHVVSATIASVVRDGREVVVGRVFQLPAGGWLFESAEGCPGT